MNFRRLIAIANLLLILLTANSLADGGAESIRVAILKGAEEIRLEGDSVLAVDDRGNPIPLNLPCILRRASDGQIIAGGRTARRLTLSAPTKMRLNGKSYRGFIDIYPQAKGVLVVNELPLEDYLVGLINCEISSLWPIEAVKSQAVIARTYAIYQKDARKGALYHLESSVMDQVYDGADIEDGRAARAVDDTAGEVLSYNGVVIQSFYHSNCGGHTEASVNVWGAALPYLQGVECRYCLTTPASKWEVTLSLKKIEGMLKAAGYQVAGLSGIKPGKVNRSGRLQEITLNHNRHEQPLPAVVFRKAMGYSVIKSTNFAIRQRGDDLTFAGVGNGHGVGLCQWGAKQRAGDGFSYREILSYYYPGVDIARLR